MDKNFDVIITGVGGQGIITLLSLINEAAFIEGNDVKSSELHGLSQRGGAVEAHIRFGKKVYSPLVQLGRADLVISTEMVEGLRAFSHAGKKAVFIVNNHFMPFDGSPKKEEVSDLFKKLSLELHLLPASDVCKEKLQNDVLAGVMLLGYAVNKKLIPLKEESVLEAIKRFIPEKYRDINVKAFELAKAI